MQKVFLQLQGKFIAFYIQFFISEKTFWLQMNQRYVFLFKVVAM